MTLTTKFINKAVVIDAVQFQGSNWAEMQAFTKNNFARKEPVDVNGDLVFAEVFDEIDGSWINVRHGDWVVRGINGEFYPIDPVVFGQTYNRYYDAA